MAHFNKLILACLFVFLGLFFQARAQSISYDMRYRQFISVDSDTLYLDVTIRRRSPVPFKLGTSDFLLNVNTEALDTANVTITRFGRWSADSSSFYENPQVFAGVDKFITLRVIRNLNSTDPGFEVPTVEQLIARIAIPVKADGGCSLNSEVSWRRHASATRARGVVTDSASVNISGRATWLPIAPAQFPLRIVMDTVLISAVAKPNGVLYRWGRVFGALNYQYMQNNSGTWTDVPNGPSSLYMFTPLAFLDSTSIRIRAIGGCDTAYSDTLGVRAIPCPTVTGNVTASSPSICLGTALTVSANHNNANGLVSYDGGITFVTKKDSVFSAITQDTTINVMLKDSFGCTSPVIPLVVTMKNKLIPTALVTALNTSSCTSEPIALSGTATGGTESNPLITEWTTNGLGQILDKNSLNTTYIPSASDQGTIFFKLVASNECKSAETETTTTMVFSPSSDANYYVKGSEGSQYFSPARVYVSEEVFVEVKTVSANAKYKWIFGTGNPADTSELTSTSFKYMTPGTYRAMLVALGTSLPSCPDTSYTDIVVEKSVNVFVPNVFSPYATNVNDRTFRVFGYISPSDFNMTVYNRWGQVVFETSDMEQGKKGWNGAKDNGSTYLPAGTYTYSIRGKFLDGTPFDKAGSVLLVQ